MNKALYAPIGIATLIMMLGLASTSIEAAFDLSGTWEGSGDCKVFNGASVSVAFDDHISISQSGTVVFLRSRRFGVDTFYRGVVIESATHPGTLGRAAIGACRTSAGGGTLNGPVGINELIDMAVSTPAQGRSELTATSVLYLENGAAFGLGQGPVIGTCQLKYVRVSLADPGVRNCAP